MTKEISAIYTLDMKKLISNSIIEKNNDAPDNFSGLAETLMAEERKQDIIGIKSNENADSVVITITTYYSRGKYFDASPETITLPKSFIDLIAEAYKK